MAAAVQLTEDQADDVIYSARTGDLEDLRSTVEELAQAASCSRESVITAAIDPYSGNTPLHMAAANGHEDVLGYLLNPTSNPSASTSISTPVPSLPNSTTQPSTDASSDTAKSTEPPSISHTSTLDLSVINHANSSRNTALHWAALNGHLGCVRLLVNGGADVGLENAAKHDALDEAERAGKVDVVRFLLARMSGKKEEEIVLTGAGGGEKGGETGDGEEEDNQAEDEEEDEEDMEGESGGVKVTQEQLERLGLEDQAKSKGKG